jgi:hypothetical protein
MARKQVELSTGVRVIRFYELFLNENRMHFLAKIWLTFVGRKLPILI